MEHTISEFIFDKVVDEGGFRNLNRWQQPQRNVGVKWLKVGGIVN